MLLKRIYPILFLLAPFSCLFAAPAPPTRPAFTRLTVEDGLSNNSVLCLLQDRTGIFWIGTNGGLNRYDGTSFIQYSILSHPGLISNTITALMQDNTGLIWIATDEGLETMDPATDSLRPFVHDDKDPSSLPGGAVRAVNQMHDGSIWILSGNWLARYNGKGGFIKIAIDPSLLGPDKVFTAFTEDKEDGLWLSYLDQPTVLARRSHEPTGRDSLGAEGASWPGYVNVYIDPGGTQWGTSPYGLARYNRRAVKSQPWIKNTFAKGIPPLHLHTCYTTDADGNIWQGARTLSLVRYDLAGREPTDYSWLLSAAEASMVYCLYRDLDNTIWIGTDNGIIKFSGRSSSFKSIPFIIDGVEQKEIRCRKVIQGAGGTLYAGTESHGLLKLTPSSAGGYTTTQLSNSGHPAISALPIKDNYYTVPVGRYNIGFIYDLCMQDSSILWFAGYGVGRYDPGNPELQVFLADGDETTRRESIVEFSICPDGHRMWLGGQFDIYVFDTVTRRMKPFTDDRNTRPFHGISTWCLRKQGDWIWAGTSKGLFKINTSTNRIQQVSPLQNMDYAVNDICIDTDSTFWLSTAGGGLVHYDPGTGQSHQYTTMDGLSNNTLCGVLKDNNGNLWISTYAGLNYLDRQSLQFTVFYAKDGLGMDEFNRKAFTKLSDGRLIFGGLNGYIIFDPRAVFKAYLPASIRICRTQVTTSNGVDTPTIFGADRLRQLVIQPGDKFFAVSYALTDLYDPRGDRYLYKLEGIDNDWHFIGNQHTLSFLSLPPGHYTLHVKGVAAKGLPAGNELTLPIVVNQVFYRRPWFLVLLALGLAIVIYGIVYYRIREWKKLQYLRTRIASDLHDEIGSNLVRITLLAENAHHQNSSSPARETLNAIAAISRNAITTIKDVVWSIDARYDTMVGMVDYMHEHMHNMLAPADIDFSFRHNGLPMDYRLNMHFRQNVYLIYKESINNIVKHSRATQVDVELQSREGVFIMNIKDNGRGMKEKKGTGHGLGNMQMRATRIKGTLEVRSQNSGVTVSLEAPYKT